MDWPLTGQKTLSLSLESGSIGSYQRDSKFYLDPCLHRLRGCISIVSLASAKYSHAHLLKNELKFDLFFTNNLIKTYANCGSIESALQVFGSMHVRNIFTWTIMITAYVQSEQEKEALSLFLQMQQDQVTPDRVTFITTLNACAVSATARLGKLVHAHILRCGFHTDLVIGNALIDIYAKCGNIHDGCQIFDRMPIRDVVSWNTLIAGYTHQCMAKEAFDLFEKLQQEGMKPDFNTYAIILNICKSTASLEHGRWLHNQVLKSEYANNGFIENTFIVMYSRCGSIEDARQVFDNMLRHDIVSWGAIIAAYVKCNNHKEAVYLFDQMSLASMQPNTTIFVSTLSACTNMMFLNKGKKVHANILKDLCELQVFIGSSLIDMYAKCGDIKSSAEIFQRLPSTSRDIVTWSAMIAGYAQHRCYNKVYEVFSQVQQTAIELSEVTFLSILTVCSDLQALAQGRRVHACSLKSGSGMAVFVASNLIVMYAKCGSMIDACLVFTRVYSPNIVSWTAIIAGHARQGGRKIALSLFREMQHAGVKPNDVCFMAVLGIYAEIAALEQGKRVHIDIIDAGLGVLDYVGSTLIDMYAKCGSIKDADKVFLSMSHHDVVSWNAIIAGHASLGDGKMVLKMFNEMQKDGTRPNEVTFLSILSAFSHRWHAYASCHFFVMLTETYRMAPGIPHYVSIIHNFSRAGHLHEAKDLVNMLPIEATELIWMPLLSACRIHGDIWLGQYVMDQFMKYEEPSTPLAM